METRDSFIEIGRYTSLQEAEQICSFLKGFDIEAHLTNANSARMMSYALPALGNVPVFIPSNEIEKAKELLLSLNNEKNQSEKVSTAEETSEQISKRALMASVIGVSFVPFLGTFYSIYLIGSLFLSKRKHDLSGRALIYTLASIGINLLGLGFLLIFFF